jgi:hypothetical protein
MKTYNGGSTEFLGGDAGEGHGQGGDDDELHDVFGANRLVMRPVLS